MNDSVTTPRHEYEKLLRTRKKLKRARKALRMAAEIVESLEDKLLIRDANAVMHSVALGLDESIPSEMVDRLLDGEPPVKVWREYRGLSQKELSDAAGIEKSALILIETDESTDSVSTLLKLANILNVQIDDLVTYTATDFIEKARQIS